MGEGRITAEQALRQEYVHVHVQIEDRLHLPTSAQQPENCPSETATRTPEIPAAITILPLSLQPSSQETPLALPECRICQEEEELSLLEAPCDCSGTLKYAHRACVQRWCDEKGDTICEICHQPYKSGYRVSQLQYQDASVALDLSDTWEMELRDPRIVALAAAQRRFLEADYEDYTAVNSGSAACCRSVVLILMALLLLRHATAMAAAADDEDALWFLMIFLLRVIGFLLPCYIMIHAMNMLQQGHREEAAATTAAEVSVLLRGRHPRSIRVALVPAVDLP